MTDQLRGNYWAKFMQLLSCLVVVFSLGTTAQASTAVLLPPQVEKGVAHDGTDQAIEELTRLVKAHGFDVISPGQAAASAEEAQQSGGFSKQLDPHDCRTPGCATEYRKLFDANFAVQLSLAARGSKIRSVAVMITETARTYFVGSAQVEGGDIRGAVQAAYGVAHDKYLRGEGPWLSVAGTPDGALVYLNGEEYGRVPFERRHIEPGTHRVDIRHDGFISQTYQVRIPTRIDHEERIAVTLRSMLNQHREPQLVRTWDYVVGSVLLAVGAVHFGMGIHQSIKKGDCAERRADGVCERAYGDKEGAARENLLLGLGGAALVAGGVVIWAAPIGHLQLRAQRNKDTAFVSLQGQF